MAYTEAGKRATMKYMKANYDRIEIKVPKGRKVVIADFAESIGESTNGLVNRLLREEMKYTESEWKESAEE